MADYSIIADVSAALLRLLRTELSPEPLVSMESIALAAPNDKNGDFQLGIYLYDIQELTEYRTSAPVRGPNNTRSYPDKPLTLHYMLFVNNRAQIAAGAETEQRVLGRAIQALMDNPELDIASAQPYAQSGEQPAMVALRNLSTEEKSKLWSSQNLPCQVAVYLTVSPVSISSRHSEKFIRVREAQFRTAQIKPNQG